MVIANTNVYYFTTNLLVYKGWLCKGCSSLFSPIVLKLRHISIVLLWTVGTILPGNCSDIETVHVVLGKATRSLHTSSNESFLYYWLNFNHATTELQSLFIYTKNCKRTLIILFYSLCIYHTIVLLIGRL